MYKRALSRWKLGRFAKLLLLALSMAALAHPIWDLLLERGARLADLLTFFAIGLLLYLRRPMHTLGLHDVARHLNRRHPQLEHSSELLLKPGSQLNMLERLQAQKVGLRLEKLQKRETYPKVAFKSTILLLLCSFGLNVLLAKSHLLKPNHQASATSVDLQPVPDKNAAAGQARKPLPLPLAIESVGITIIPPAYTRLPTRKSKLQNISVPEGSDVRWELTTNRPAGQAKLIFNDTETLPLEPAGKSSYEGGKTVRQAGHFRLLAEGGKNEAAASDYYKLDVVKDMPPQVQIIQPDESVEVDLAQSGTLVVKARARDDYQIAGTYLMATITKGKGEAVTFREERVPIAGKSAGENGELLLEAALHFPSLKVEPGNELFFYVAATDNKQPQPNTGRSNMHYISFADTAQIATFESGGLGVDLMPAYFRSQRQIINDTEKLIAGHREIPHEKWMQRANTIGEDQKLLRLRYGKFLGEEYESGIWAPEEAEAHDGHGEHGEGGEEQQEATEHIHRDHDNEGEEDGEHRHDQNCEHLHGEESEETETGHGGGQAEHSHDHGGGGGGNMSDGQAGNAPAFLDQFVHSHDSAEEATYFGNEIKRKLKAAMAEMWDAELQLRLGKPADALPYEHKALKLIKEVQQQSRIYVHKTGFDIAPLKEAKWRLKGELDEIAAPKVRDTNNPPAAYPNARQALRLLNRPDVAAGSPKLGANDLQTLRQAGNELSRASLAQQGNYLSALGQLRQLLTEYGQTGSFCTTCARQVQAALWQLLPDAGNPRPKTDAGLRSLSRAYRKHLYGN